MLDKIRNKRGSTLILTYIIIVFALVFSFIIVDIGYAYVTKIQMENITDAMAIAGGSYGKYAYYNIIDGTKRAVIDPQKANSKANEIFNANMRYVNNRVTLTKQYNPTISSYYAGDFIVRMNGKVQTFFLGNSFLGTPLNMPFLSFDHRARVHVEPR